jgi:hypothetical protein
MNMKSNLTNESRENGNGASTLSQACLKSCKRILAQIGRAKDAIFAEARDTLEVQDQMLRLVLNEAEALAWQTRFPHLFFPALAVEKVQEAAAWDSRQRAVAGRTRASY